jgi:predicted PurR-regulated permease PerM
MQDTPRDLTRIMLAVFFISILMVGSFTIIQPFLAAAVWAVTLVIASWSVLLRVERAFGGRRAPAVAVMTLVLLLIVLVPLWLAISTIVGQANRIGALATALPDFQMPDPPVWLAGIPVVGGSLVELWTNLSDLKVSDIVRRLAPHAGTVTQWFIGAVGNLGGLLVQLLLTIAIAAVLYASGEAAATLCRRFGRRLAGPRGDDVVVLAGQAIRGVALGIVVTAVAQAAIGGLGLVLAGVPQAPVLTAVMLILCIAQIGPALVLLPAVIWLFVDGQVASGVILAVFGGVALTIDNFLRPILIRRGADLPLALVLVGVIGGLISMGLVGLFIGPVILAVTYTLLLAWIDEQDASPG